MSLRIARELRFSPSRLVTSAACSNDFFLVVIFTLAGLDLSLWFLATGWLSAATLGSALPL